MDSLSRLAVLISFISGILSYVFPNALYVCVGALMVPFFFLRLKKTRIKVFKDRDGVLAGVWAKEPQTGDNYALTNTTMHMASLPVPSEYMSAATFSFTSSKLKAKDAFMSMAQISNVEGFACRGYGSKAFQSRFILKRVCRVMNDLAKPNFVSKCRTPEEESSRTASKSYKLSMEGEADIIRCGDVVVIEDASSSLSTSSARFLCVKDDWYIGYSKSNNARAYFQVALLDADGNLNYGEPLRVGQPFRLRCARWPALELYMQMHSDAGESARLVLHEVLEGNSGLKVPTKSKVAGQVIPLELSLLVPMAKRNIRISRLLQPYQGVLDRIVSSLRLSSTPTFHVHAAAWTSVYNRVSQMSMPAALLVCVDGPESGSCGGRVFTCVRPIAELISFIDSNEVDQHGIRTRIYESEDEQRFFTLSQKIQSFMTRGLSKDLQNMKKKAHSKFKRYLSQPSFLEAQFLLSGAEQFGVTPTSVGSVSEPQFVECVGRVLGETRVAEEVVSVTPNQINFFVPHAKRPTFAIPIQSILGVYTFSGAKPCSSPFPGFHAVCIDTIPKLHVLIFRALGSRNTFKECVGRLIKTSRRPNHTLDEDNDPFSFFPINTRWMPAERRVLNGRVPVFATQSRVFMQPAQSHPFASSTKYPHVRAQAIALAYADGYEGVSHTRELWVFSYRLLCMISELHLLEHSEDDAKSSTEHANKKFAQKSALQIEYLNEVGKLKLVNLSKLPCDSVEALCFFVNIYHALLMHSQLAVGRPSQADWASFFSFCSYEIGDEVFSLSELEQCAIRGSLSAPRETSKFDALPVVRNDARFRYALGEADSRISFLLNSGSISNPSSVYALTPRNIEKQLQKVAYATLANSVQVDLSRSTIVLPKICEVYRNDFGHDTASLLLSLRNMLLVKADIRRSVQGFSASDYLQILEDSSPSSITVRYLKATHESHATLKLYK